MTTLAALWTGYLLMQQRWVAENAELTDTEDAIRPLFSSVYPEQLSPHPARTPQHAQPGPAPQQRQE
ncbi:MAG: hypothetical protein AAF531_19355 [Actinomycetota bacterium]